MDGDRRRRQCGTVRPQRVEQTVGTCLGLSFRQQRTEKGFVEVRGHHLIKKAGDGPCVRLLQQPFAD